jgi:hypothetical protein
MKPGVGETYRAQRTQILNLPPQQDDAILTLSVSSSKSMKNFHYLLSILFLSSVLLPGAERSQSFDTDPRWDGHNNRPAGEPREVVQDFGYSATKTSTATPGEIGGTITPAGEPAWYAAKLAPLTFNDKFSASGTMVVPVGGGNTLIGFFDPATAREWRTANSLVWRINGRGETFHAHFEYMTQKWRAGAGVIGRHDQVKDRMHPIENPSGDSIYNWSLAYNPSGTDGNGIITAKLGTHTAACPVTPELRADGALFTHFGILNVIKSVDGSGKLYIGELVINGKKQNLSHDPGWEGHNNHAKYKTIHVRPWFDVGWSDSNHADGTRPGEIGGHFYRGDCRDASRLGYYGARLGTLTLDRPLRARGRISFHRGVSDSTTLIGFFHHERSIRVNQSQNNGTPENFLGFALEGPSSEGFFVYPVCRPHSGDTSVGFDRTCPRIYPDDSSHEWTLEYDPAGAGGQGTLVVSLDGQSKTLELIEGTQTTGAKFDRFGFVSTWIDGNGQTIYLDNLAYTTSQD